MAQKEFGCLSDQLLFEINSSHKVKREDSFTTSLFGKGRLEEIIQNHTCQISNFQCRGAEDAEQAFFVWRGDTAKQKVSVLSMQAS